MVEQALAAMEDDLRRESGDSSMELNLQELVRSDSGIERSPLLNFARVCLFVLCVARALEACT